MVFSLLGLCVKTFPSQSVFGRYVNSNNSNFLGKLTTKSVLAHCCSFSTRQIGSKQSGFRFMDAGPPAQIQPAPTPKDDQDAPIKQQENILNRAVDSRLQSKKSG